MKTTEYDQLLDQYPDTAVIFGGAAGPAFSRLLLERRVRRLALFTGRTSADATGNFGRFAALCGTTDTAVIRYTDIPAEPDIPAIDRMVAFLRDTRPDAVAALGGGSVMDAAKAAYLVAQAGGKVADFFGSDRYSARFENCDPKRVICFPTTAGTGSEVTPYANIVDREVRVKKLISDAALIPANAFVLPEMSASMPRRVTLTTGCDALAHLLEGFLNIRQDHRCAEANRWALAGIRLIVDHFRTALDRPDAASRAAMAAAATLGGMVIRYKSTGLPHLCSFSWFGVLEHGLAVAMILPAAWRFYLKSGEVAARTMLLADLFPGGNPDEVVESFRRFLTSCGVPRSLKEVPGITDELLEATARGAVENPMKLALAPRQVSPAEAYAVITRILAASAC